MCRRPRRIVPQRKAEWNGGVHQRLTRASTQRPVVAGNRKRHFQYFLESLEETPIRPVSLRAPVLEAVGRILCAQTRPP